MVKTFIIAEAGVNHNGNYETAIALIDAAKKAGADAVKFQTWKTELLMSKQTELAEYQKESSLKFQNQYDMAKELELSYSQFIQLKKYCDQINIIFLSTPDEFESAKFLYDLQDIFKIGSGEINNLPFLRYIGSFNKKIILSTGTATMEEVNNAVNILISAGTLKEKITVLHCTSEYPTPLNEVNLNAMCSIANNLNIEVGYSDHSLGIEVSIAAVALGAKIIEKHFTLNRKMKGPDHKASLEPHELKLMINYIRNIESALGDGIKRPTLSEKKNINIIRKSIVAARLIKKGEIFDKNNLAVKRPGYGISPMDWEKVIDKKAPREFKKNEFIDL